MPGGSSSAIAMELRDYNGTGRWSCAGILERYAELCRQHRVSPRPLIPAEIVQGEIHRVYPLMQQVIAGIEAKDLACIILGVDFVHEDTRFPFGKTLKSNTARALRRAPLRPDQIVSLRRRFVAMLIAGNVPHEFKQYARLLKKLGLGELREELVARAPVHNRYVKRWLDYLL